MKLTVTEWTWAQNWLPETPEGKLLDNYIEYRTFGRRWSQVLAIGLNKQHEAMVRQALADREAAAQSSVDGGAL